MTRQEVADQIKSLVLQTQDFITLEDLSNQLLKNSQDKTISSAQRKREALMLCLIGGCLR